VTAGRIRSTAEAPPFTRRYGQHRSGYRSPRRRLRQLLCCIALAAALLGVVSGGLIYLHKPSQRLVVASVPYWNMTYGTASVLSNLHTFSEMSPWMYGLDRSGQIVPQYPPQEAAAVQAQLARLRAARMPLLPTLANVIGGRWAYRPVITSILHDPAVRARHIAAIVALVQREDYAGIDIDYEDLQASDRTAFTTFITQLAGALHVAGKMLSVDLFAKSSNRGYDQRNLAQDYQAIGRVADQVRLMGYDYHWADSGPGPVAPIGWIRAVLSYAKTQIPAGKIILGVPLYGYDWSGGHGTPVSWLQAFHLSERYDVQPHFDAASQSPWFAYTDAAGRRHVVWFENGPSTQAKFQAAQDAGIGGVYVWIYGLEDTSIWAAVRQALPHRVPASSLWSAGI
jgi:spore germination protein